MIGILYFHQGWTDIINCLSLIDYYLDKYQLHLIIRDDSKNLIDYYIGNKNVIVHYINKNILDNTNINQTIEKFNLGNYETLFHGYHDKYNNIKNINKFKSLHIKNGNFVRYFFETYNIPFNVRINYFNIERKLLDENNIYEQFIKKYGNNYILYHGIDTNNIKNMNNENIIDINLISDIFFDYIKVIENAKELHLLYAKRGYIDMFLQIKLLNWNIIE